MRSGWMLIVVLLAAAPSVWGASGSEGSESYTPTPWALVCAPGAGIEHPPAWFKGFGLTRVSGRLDVPENGEAELRLERDFFCPVEDPEAEVELAVALGFCVGESWAYADLELWLEPLADELILGASLALRPVAGNHFVEVPATLSPKGKALLTSSSFALPAFQDPLSGEVEVLLRVVVRPGETCALRGGHGVSLRHVSLGVPGG